MIFTFTRNPVQVQKPHWTFFSTLSGDPIVPIKIEGSRVYLPEGYIGEEIVSIIKPTYVNQKQDPNAMIGELQDYIAKTFESESSGLGAYPLQINVPPPNRYIEGRLALSNRDLSYIEAKEGSYKLRAGEFLPIYTNFIYTIDNILLFDGDEVLEADSFTSGVYKFLKPPREVAACII